MKLRLATRKSKLALVQARWVARELKAHTPGLEVEEVHVVTQGDRIQDVPLSEVGGKGLFVSEVEATLLEGRADLAVHSMKDLPSELADGLIMACIPAREDPRDALLSKDGEHIDALTAGSRIGTSSLRRTALLRAHRRDLEFASLRGNVDTRLRKLDEGQYDAIVLACAGLRRLGLDDRPHFIIPRDIAIPAVGQGALGIQSRTDDTETRALLAHLEHAPTRVEVDAERAFLGHLEGSCKVPIAGHAQLSEDGSRLAFRGMVGSIDGERLLSAGSETYVGGKPPAKHGELAHELGLEVARTLEKQGARELIREAVAAAERTKKQGNGGGGDGGGRFGRWN